MDEKHPRRSSIFNKFAQQTTKIAVFLHISKVQINYSSTTSSKNGALVQNGLNIYRGVARAQMELFAEIVNSF